MNYLLLLGLLYLIYKLSSGLSLFGTPESGSDPNKIVVTPYDIELNLLTLASLVIKADGQINQKELDFVRQYFVEKYGKEYANATFKTFNEITQKREIVAYRICYYLLHKTSYGERLQIIQFLFGIAMADGSISYHENAKIEEIAGFLKIYQSDFNTIRMMFYIQEKKQPIPPNAYKVLNLEATATDAEVKKAYRDLVKKYHPDKVITDSELIKKEAETNFRQVQEAYEQIQKERGF